MKKITTVICAVVLVCSLMSGCNSTKKVSVAEAVNIALEGANGYASASASIDDAVLTKQLTAAGLTEAEAKELRNSMNVKFKNYSGAKLSNGDELTVNVSYDAELAKKFKVEISDTTKTIKTSGLVNPQPYDPFKEIELRCYGGNGRGWVKIVPLNDEIDLTEIEFVIPQLKNHRIVANYSNGEIATCYVVFDEEKLLKQGKDILTVSKSYKIEGLLPVEEYEKNNAPYNVTDKDFLTKYSYTVLKEIE